MPLFPGADPYSADGGSTGILLLHGFTGSPKSMKPWGERMAAEGHSVRVPRLPGHGTRWQDMNLTRWEDWYAEADRSYGELAKSCDRVFVFGLSMGGSLALRLAEQYGDAIRGIVLVNPAVHSERPDRFLLPVLQAIVPAFPGISNDIKKPGQDEGAYDKIPLKAAHSLTKLWKLVKDDLPKVRNPLLLFRSEVDHVVEASNSRYILDHVSSSDKTEVVLKDSFHVATVDNDAEAIVTGSIAFVNRLS
ncbi:MAG: esterase [Actinomycetales bacterium mxb001]|nr:MAG: esterase [Actinomycetales bacterium mxb001]